VSDNIIARNKIEIAIDGSGVDVGIAKIDKSIKGLARSANVAGKDAAKGIGDIGVSGAGAATSVDKSTKQIINSIQRQTAAFQAGKRGTAEYYQSIASLKGANLDALKPYISQLKEAQFKADALKDSNVGLTSSIKGMIGAYAGIASIAVLGKLSKDTIDLADNMNDLSRRTGLAVEQIGAWRLATEQSGTSIEALTGALGKGSKYLVEHGEDLKKIGINAKTSEELILKLSGVISKIPSDDPRRTALAMQVLGKSAGELIPLLSEGEGELRKMLNRGKELNPVTADLAKNADAFNDSLAELKLVSSGLFVDLVSDTLPSLVTYLGQMKLIVNEGDWLDKLAFFTTGYVSGKVADQTEKPETQILRYRDAIVELKKELAKAEKFNIPFVNKDALRSELLDLEAGLKAQRQRLPVKVPKRQLNPSDNSAESDAFSKKLNDFLGSNDEANKAAKSGRKAKEAQQKSLRDQLKLIEQEKNRSTSS